MTAVLVILAVASLLLCDVQGSDDFEQSEPEEESDLDTSNVPPTHVSYPRRKFLKVFKSSILRALNRTAPPTLNHPLPQVSSHLRRLSSGKDDKEFNTFAIPRNKIFGCFESNRWDCSRFEFEVTPDNFNIKSVRVWFHKRVQTSHLFLSVFFNGTSNAQQYDEYTSDVITEKGWIGFALQRSALEHVGEILSCIVEVKGGPVFETDAESPFLEVTKSAPPARRRRTTNSSSNASSNNNNNCCVVDRVVNLTELEWDNWLIAPVEVNVRACSGTCQVYQNTFNLTYGGIMYNMGKKNLSYAAANTMREFWVPHCFPDKMSKLKILYFNTTGVIVEADVQNIVIDSCACMDTNCHRN